MSNILTFELKYQTIQQDDRRGSKIEDNFLFPNITVGVSVETITKFLAGPWTYLSQD